MIFEVEGDEAVNFSVDVAPSPTVKGILSPPPRNEAWYATQGAVFMRLLERALKVSAVDPRCTSAAAICRTCAGCGVSGEIKKVRTPER